LDDLYAEKCRAIRAEIESLADERITSDDLPAIVSDILERYSEDCPEMLKGQHWASEPEGQRYQEEVVFEVHIPFNGEGRAFGWHARARPIGANEYSVHGNTLVVRLSVERARVQMLDKKIDDEFNFLETYLRDLRDMIPKWNEHLKGTIEDALRHRNAELEKKRAFEKNMAGLSVPIRRRDEAVIETIVPVKRKAVRPRLATSAPERSWLIEQRMYDDILRSLESMVKVMERSPSTFCHMDEEALRDVLLVNLNGIYEGAASSETFNGEGKTDILLRWEDKNVFIAECLIWKGPEYLRQKMDEQLFNYATWRDSRLVLIVFSKNTDFTKVVTSMRETIKSHSQCVQVDTTYNHESGARYIFHRKDDRQRELQLTSIAFHVPQKT
jgi:hypothetical protein